jgi:hypothetical protein
MFLSTSPLVLSEMTMRRHERLHLWDRHKKAIDLEGGQLHVSL